MNILTILGIAVIITLIAWFIGSMFDSEKITMFSAIGFILSFVFFLFTILVKMLQHIK